MLGHSIFRYFNIGYTPDTLVLLQFQFWEPVLYAKYDGKFPSDSTELKGRFVGIAKNVGPL
jgi:hypothetical protein